MRSTRSTTHTARSSAARWRGPLCSFDRHMNPASAAINADRLWSSLMTMAEIGKTPGGGVRRLALSDEDRAARDLLAEWLRGAGVTVRVDDLGNMYGRRGGTESGAAPV